MDNSLSLGQRVFSAVVAALTIVWAAGVAAFAVPQTASAANAGDLVRGTSFSTVYFYGYDGMRYAFPNENTYNTWFNDFSGLQTISDSALENITLGGNVVYRPGSRWIKITSAAETYAVARDGMIHWIESESVASDLAGSAWNTMIDDVADVFFTDYTEGMSLSSATAWNGALYMDGGDYYVAWDGEKRMLSAAARSANNLENRFFLTGSNIDDSALTAGADITGFVCELSDASQSGECGSEDTTTPTGGNLSVSVASNTTPATLVPTTASRVNVTSWNLSAAQATTLSSLTVSLGGLASTGDFDNVYLYEGNVRLTDGRSFNSSTRTTTFAGLNLAFNAGQTRTLSAVVDMDGVSNRTFRIGLAEASAVGTNGTVSGSFPAWGNTHTTTEADLGEITVSDVGPVPTNPSLGAVDHTIARFRLEASADEAIDVDSLTFEVRRAEDHSNFRLWQGTTQVATGQSVGRDLVHFDFNSSFLLEEGASRNFHITANIGGKVGDKIETSLRNVADVNATGRDFGFGVSVENNYNMQDHVEVEGGQVTLAFVGPNDADVRTGATAHKFLEFSLTSEEWAEVDKVEFALTGSTVDAGNAGQTRRPLRNFRLINAANGNLLAGSAEMNEVPADAATANLDQTITFTDTFYVNAGETIRLAVVADVNRNDSEAGDVFSVSLGNVRDGAPAEKCGSICLENIDRDDISDIVPSTGVSGRDQTIIDSELTLALANTPNGNVSAVRGSSNVEAAAFTFEASEGDSIVVSDVTVTAAGANLGAHTPRDLVAACSLYNRGNDALVAGPRSLTTGQELQFTGMNLEIAGGSTTTLALRCNLADVTPNGGALVSFHLLTGAVTASESSTGNSVAGSPYPVNGANTGASSVRLAPLPAGALTLTVDSSRPDAKFLLAGANDQAVSTFRFNATNEDFRVRTLTIGDVAANGTSSVSSVTIDYPTQTGRATRTLSLTGSEARFANLDMYVARNSTALVHVSADISETRNNDGFADSNSRVQLEVVMADGENKFEAVGVGSSDTLRDEDGDLESTSNSHRHVVRQTTPSLNAPQITRSQELENGDTLHVFTLNVASNSNGPLGWNSVLLEVTGAGDWNNCSTTTVHRINSDTMTITRTNSSNPLSATVTPHLANMMPILVGEGDCNDGGNTDDQPARYVRVELAETEIVPQGSSRTYEFEFLVGGLDQDSSQNIRFSLPRESTVPFVAELTDIDADGQESAPGAEDDAFSATTAEITLDDATFIPVGSVLRANGERMLVVDKAGDDVVVVRGYANTNASVLEDEDGVDVSFSNFFWTDHPYRDANSESELYHDFWGGFLVNTVPLQGPSHNNFFTKND